VTTVATRQWRRWLFKILAALYALFWLNVTLSAGSTGQTHRLQEFGYRTLYALGLVVVPAIVQLRRPERNVAAQQQLILTATAHMIGTFIAVYVDPLAYALVALAIVLAVLHPRRARVFVPGVRADRVTITAATVITVPLVIFVVGQARLLRSDGSSQWEDTIVFAIAMAFSLAVAAARTVGWRVPAWTAAIALVGYGLASALSPDQASSWGRGWGVGGHCRRDMGNYRGTGRRRRFEGRPSRGVHRERASPGTVVGR